MPNYVNTTAALTVKFYDRNNALFDPTTVRLHVITPFLLGQSNDLTFVYGQTADIVRDSTGSYHYDLLCETAGTVIALWFSDASNQRGFSETVFTVIPSPI